MKRKIWKRIFLGFGIFFLLLVILVGHPVFHILKTAWYDRDEIIPTLTGKINDASRLDETKITRVWKIPTDPAAATEQLAGLLQYARTNHLRVSIAGARHSMGGHTIYPDGVVIDMLPFNHMELDGANLVLHVQAGARWSEVIPFLNAHGLSVEVMQSNDDFSVGGSLSVDCHGWQFNRPPIASTVMSLHLMLADGTVKKCSRTENPELFSLVLGGYGLFGVILDADLKVVPNENYRIERLVVPTADYISTLDRETVGKKGAAMVYGRLRVTAEHFLQEGIINVFYGLRSTNVVSNLSGVKDVRLQRAIFRGSVGDEYGKQLRWDAEKNFSAYLAGDLFERNSILYEPASWFQDHSKATTDILVECFVPPKEFEPLLEDLRKIIPQNQADLLNVTVRDINRDDDAFLRYADKNVISLVMLFVQTRDAAGEAKMEKLTQEIVTASLRHAGRYYLPYRLHATPDQFNAAYPQAKEFFQLKRKYDPGELFQNEFYLKYGE